MAPTNTSKRKPPALKKGRPPTALKPSTSLSARATRKIIRGHHQLNKQLALAQSTGDEIRATEIRQELERLGGLKLYQAASIQGQSAERGGDSSSVLVEWLRSYLPSSSSSSSSSSSTTSSVWGKSQTPRPRLRMLEIGALSTKNAGATSGLFSGGITRIDLNAQTKGIERQDFMRRPLPPAPPGDADGERINYDLDNGDDDDDDGKFDLISLSLVLNFVPDAPQRGEMLRRTTRFLRDHRRRRDPAASSSSRGGGGDGSHPSSTRVNEGDEEADDGHNQDIAPPFPSLFLVLPAPCLTNSRYFDEERLTSLMASLGYALLRRKQTAKLIYTLWLWRDGPAERSQRQQQRFGKVEIKRGGGLNNFRIELECT